MPKRADLTCEIEGKAIGVHIYFDNLEEFRDKLIKEFTPAIVMCWKRTEELNKDL